MAAHVAMVAGLSAAELHAADSAKARGKKVVKDFYIPSGHPVCNDGDEFGFSV